MCGQKSRDMGSGHLVVIPHSIGNPYLDLPKGAKGFLKGVNSPSLGFNWHPLEGAGILGIQTLRNWAYEPCICFFFSSPSHYMEKMGV